MDRLFKFKIDSLKQDKYTINPAGFLLADAILTRSGIFNYYDDNGKLTRELRPPEEVFSRESMDSLKMVPITFLHPDGKVDGENFRQVMIGNVGEIVKREGNLLGCRVQIMDTGVVKMIIDRHKAGLETKLSMGYTCSLIDNEGQTEEGHYDKIQTNIRYNHLSLVNKGRAGTGVKLKLDEGNKTMSKSIITRAAIALARFHMDAMSLEVPDEAKKDFEHILVKLDEATSVVLAMQDELAEKDKILTKTQAESDERKDSLEKVTKELGEWKNPASGNVQAMLKARTDLEDIAKSLKVDTKDLSDKDIRIAVITKMHPKFDAKDLDEVYISARFDAIVELIEQDRKDGNTFKLGQFRSSAVQSTSDGNKDPRAEFMDKSDALARGDDPEKV